MAKVSFEDTRYSSLQRVVVNSIHTTLFQFETYLFSSAPLQDFSSFLNGSCAEVESYDGYMIIHLEVSISMLESSVGGEAFSAKARIAINVRKDIVGPAARNLAFPLLRSSFSDRKLAAIKTLKKVTSPTRATTKMNMAGKGLASRTRLPVMLDLVTV